MIRLYVREKQLELLAYTVYQALCENKLDVVLTDDIDTNTDDIYLITGGEYLTSIPKNYLVIQTVPTSPLTLTSKVEAYWISKEYLSLLENAIHIFDVSTENIKVWNDFYDFKNTSFLPVGYSTCMKEKVDLIANQSSLKSLVDLNNLQTKKTSNSFIIVENKRSTELYKTLSKNKDYVFTVKNCEDAFQFAYTAKLSNHPVILLHNYQNTYPDIFLAALLRYNGISCITEKSRDDKINEYLTDIGCLVIPYIRLEKDFHKTMQTNIESIKNVKTLKVELLSNKLKIPQCISKCIKTTKKRKKKVELQLYNREAIGDIEFTILGDGGISLKLGEIKDEDLPNISICTPTGNRRWIFPLALRNFMTFMYPKDKIEWNILDDGMESMEDIIPRDKRINYKFIGGDQNRISVAKKRNQLVEMSTNDIIVFMDDDDYYTPENLIARVKALLKYSKEGVKCVGCKEVATYDLIKEMAAICSNGEEYLTESSLAFTREFWDNRQFNDTDRASEFRHFLEYRQSEIRSIPFQFVTVALTHGKNTTGGVRSLDQYQKWRPSENWEQSKKMLLDILDEDAQDYLLSIKKRIPSN